MITNPVARLALFVAVLVVAFVAAFGIGQVVGPDDAAPRSPSTTVTTAPASMEMGS